MNNHQGWIKLHRKMLQWEWWEDIPTRMIFITILLLINHQDKKWRGIVIKKGSCITSQPKLAKKSGFSVRQTRTALNKLKTTGELTVKTTSRYSIITLCNWESYQQDDRQPNRQATGKRQAVDRQATTNKNVKNVKNEKNKDIHVFISHFNKKFNKSFLPTKGREAKLKLRLKTFTLKQILNSVDNLAQSKFHTGDNDRQWTADPDFLLRSDEQVDKWYVASTQQRVYNDDLEKKSDELLRKGVLKRD